MKMNNEWKGMLAGFLAYTILGFGWICADLSYAAVGQYVSIAWRFVVSLLVMTPIGLLAGKLHFKGKKWWKLLLLGCFNPILTWTFEAWGLMMTSASFSSVMVALTPIVSLFAAQVFLKEKPTLWQVLFSVLSISGVVIVTLVGSSMGTVSLLGVLALLVCIFGTVAFSLLTRKLSAEFTSFERTYGILFTGALYYIPYALIKYRSDLGVLLDVFTMPDVVLSIVYLGVFSSVVGIFLLNYSLEKITVARATVFSNWSTVVAIICGVLLLDDIFTWAQVAGSAMILFGLYGVNRFAAQTDGQIVQSAEKKAV